MARRKKAGILTHDGHTLTVNEDKFIDLYIELGNASQAVVDAGYKTKNPRQYANSLLTKTYIASEIEFRIERLQSSRIADATEIMEYFSKVMRGEITDQFGLEASLSERTKAAQELAKRQIDMVNKAQNAAAPELKISLDFNTNTTAHLPTVKDIIGDTSSITDMVNNLLTDSSKENTESVV